MKIIAAQALQSQPKLTQTPLSGIALCTSKFVVHPTIFLIPKLPLLTFFFFHFLHHATFILFFAFILMKGAHSFLCLF